MFHYNMHCNGLIGVKNIIFIQSRKIESQTCFSFPTALKTSNLLSGKDHYIIPKSVPYHTTYNNVGYIQNMLA